MNSKITPEEFELAYEQVLSEFTNIILFLAIIGPIGIIGNFLTIRFYSNAEKKPINIFLIALGIADLAVSLVTFVALVETVLNIKFQSRVLCKTFWFLYYWLVLNSLTLVSVIAIDRYRMVCKPISRRISIKKAKIITAVSVVLMMILATRAFLTVDIVQSSLKLHKTSRPSTVGLMDTEQPEVIRNRPQNGEIAHLPEMDSTGSQTKEITPELSSEDMKTADIVTSTFNSTGNSLPLIVDTTESVTTIETLTMDVTLANASKSFNNSNQKVIQVSICGFTRDPNRRVYVVSFHIGDVVFVSLVILNFLVCYSLVIRTLVIHMKTAGWLYQRDTTIKKKEKSVVSYDSQTCRTWSEKERYIAREADNQPEEMSGHSSYSVVEDDLAQTKSITMSENCSSNLKNVKTISCVSKPEEILPFEAGAISTWAPEIRQAELSAVNQSSSRSVSSPKMKESNFDKMESKDNLETTTNGKGVKSGYVAMKRSERQITIAMLAISVALLISFVPYFIATIYIQFLSTEDNSLNGTAILMTRCAFINSIVNCFIYYVFSTPYRIYVNSTFSRICSNS